jgi:hypothetical protein
MTQALRPSIRDPEAQISQQLSEAENRLVDHYAERGEITEDHVRQTFRLVSERFLRAKIRTFLPILIERATRQELEHRCSNACFHPAILVGN